MGAGQVHGAGGEHGAQGETGAAGRGYSGPAGWRVEGLVLTCLQNNKLSSGQEEKCRREAAAAQQTAGWHQVWPGDDHPQALRWGRDQRAHHQEQHGAALGGRGQTVQGDGQAARGGCLC